MQIDKFQASILKFLFEKLPINDDINSLEFSLSGDFIGKFRAGYAIINSVEPKSSVVFNLPTYSSSVFLAVTQQQSMITARILANLEDYERESALRLDLGEVVILPNTESVDKETPYAVILLRTATSLDCAEVPDRHEINGKLVSFFLAVPLTIEEWKHRRQYGHDALIEKFQEEGKELFF